MYKVTIKNIITKKTIELNNCKGDILDKNYRIFILDDETKIDYPLKNNVFYFSENRELEIKKQILDFNSKEKDEKKHRKYISKQTDIKYTVELFENLNKKPTLILKDIVYEEFINNIENEKLEIPIRVFYDKDMNRIEIEYNAFIFKTSKEKIKAVEAQIKEETGIDINKIPVMN